MRGDPVEHGDGTRLVRRNDEPLRIVRDVDFVYTVGDGHGIRGCRFACCATVTCSGRATAVITGCAGTALTTMLAIRSDIFAILFRLCRLDRLLTTMFAVGGNVAAIFRACGLIFFLALLIVFFIPVVPSPCR